MKTVIEMAQEAGVEFTFDPTEPEGRVFAECWLDELERFAALVRAAALDKASGVQEPVAEVRLMRTGGNAGLATHIVQIVEGYFPAGTKLYTAPQPAQQPLTDEQKWRLYESGADMPASMAAVYMRGIADAEAVHGITGEKK